ncbi:hypothetical protein AB833_00650 [Chromatiales bacterium (ex Bugula neritina AB1)]|nr:hypothetical protein AB833_00650 [Chromatiales bacterium (ex Bugula neritina AB1)]
MAEVIPEYVIDNPLECIFWERGANDTYQVRCADACYFLRVYRCGAFTREANEFEAQVLSYLHRKDFPVAYPIARVSGGYLTEVSAPEGPRIVLLTAAAEGAPPDYDSMENCRLVGESVAQMHLSSDGFETNFTRSRLDLTGLLKNSMVYIRDYMAHRPEALSSIEKIAQDTCAVVKAVPEESLNAGICHGDLHGGNMHIHEGKVTHFDFEECAFGYRVYDLATFKWGGACVGSGKRGVERWLAFLEGYESVRELSESEHTVVDAFVIMRELAELAYGIRHIRDFGHNGIMATDIDYVCYRLDKLISAHP